ncbi:MAG TPA: hypothetical protein PLC89_14050 [Haliscomenobacter sp.]|uniref:hypothetical protein n=1 Tax=Haliscomenobacter sp. TaxID=2717303 RepID=UPI002CC510AA|nr:hypothetical protein [Haliscomenobacter sp.]HOY18424.1 hypothetical protein [Haliscomenobacter sp.]
MQNVIENVAQPKVEVTPMTIGKKLFETTVIKSNSENDVVRTRLKKGDCCK